jgi:hypothetical protein
VLYYQSLGFSGAQIGLVAGLAPLVTMFSAPFWTGLADQTRRHRLILNVTLGVSVVILIALPQFSAFVPVLVLVLLYSAFYAPVSSFVDSATICAARHALDSARSLRCDGLWVGRGGWRLHRRTDRREVGWASRVFALRRRRADSDGHGGYVATTLAHSAAGK